MAFQWSAKSVEEGCLMPLVIALANCDKDFNSISVTQLPYQLSFSATHTMEAPLAKLINSLSPLYIAKYVP